MEKHELVKEVLERTEPGGSICVRGWVKTARHGKNRSFLSVNDGSSLESLQVVVETELGNYDEIRRLITGASIAVTGELVLSPSEGQRSEIRAERVEVVGDSNDQYPLQKKRHSFEFLRSIGHLRMRTNTIGAVMRLRSEASRLVHQFFHERGFIYLHSPIITGSDCEGAGEMFRVSSLDAGIPPRQEGGKGDVDFSKDFFGQEAHLTVSGQLEAEIAAHAFQKVYTFGPTFRAENSNTRRHLAEFWMVEPEMAFCDLECDMDLAEAFLKYLVSGVLDECSGDMAFFDERIDPGLIRRLELIIRDPFERISYDAAVQILRERNDQFEHPVEWGADFQSEHERYLVDEHAKRPVIVTDYPASIKPFYMYVNGDGRTVRAMDVLVPKIGEIIGGSQREERLDVLRERMVSAGLREEDYWWYLELRRYGSTPHAGFGLGFDRMVQFMTGMANIRDVIPFPRVPGNVAF